jgi:hypothetical protein
MDMAELAALYSGQFTLFPLWCFCNTLRHSIFSQKVASAEDKAKDALADQSKRANDMSQRRGGARSTKPRPLDSVVG